MDTKAGVITAEIKSSDPASGTFEAILSAPTIDRDGEVVDKGAFDPLPQHITIDIDHAMSVQGIVGSGTPYYDGDLLMFRGSFASTTLGQEVRTLVTEGHVNRMSVAFRQAVREIDEKDGLQHVRKGELLNAAIVAIPSNREAHILVAKALAEKAETPCPVCSAKSPTEDPEDAAAPAAAPPAQRSTKAMAALAEAALLLSE